MEATEVVKLIEEIKASAVGATDEVGRKMLELANRVQYLEQKGVRTPEYTPPAVAGPGKVVAESAEIKRLRESSFAQSVTVAVKSFAPEFARGFERKATLISVNAGIEPLRANEIFGGFSNPTRFPLRNLIPSRPIATASVDYVRTTVVGTAGVQVNQGDVKPIIDLNPTVVNAKVVTVAGWSTVSKQVLDDAQLLDEFIQGTLLDALGIAEDREILQGDGSTGRMLGLMNVAADYATVVPHPNDTAVDILRRAITQLQRANSYRTAIVVSPEGLELLELTRVSGADTRYLLTLAVDNLNRAVVWRTPIVVSAAMGTAGFLVGDFARGARIYDREQANVTISNQHADYFARNLVAILAEERLAFAATKPMAFVKGALPI